MTIVVHYLTDSRAHRVIWILEELGIHYETKVYRRTKAGLAPKSLKKVHPSGKSPVIEDGDLKIAESGLILEYLVGKYGKGTDLEPQNDREALAISYRLYACESNLMIAAMFCYIMSQAKLRAPWGLKWIVASTTGPIERAYPRPLLQDCLKELDVAIRDNRGYIVSGKLTAADVMYETSVTLIRQGGIDNVWGDEYPHIAAWMETLAKRPGYARAIAKEREYLALSTAPAL